MKKQMIISIIMASSILLSGSILAYTQVRWNQLLGFINQDKLQDVKIFLDANPSAVLWKDINNITALHFAAIKDRKAIAKLLLEKGANVNAKNKNRVTPLHFAAYEGHEDIVQLLIEKGADVNAKNKDKKTAAQVAKTDAIKNYLLEKAAQQ